MKLLIDMDGVLCDFEGRIAELFNRNPVSIRSPSVWNGSQNICDALGITKSNLWAKVKSDKGFWENLKPLPWKDELIDLALSYTNDVYICTSPGISDPVTLAGKAVWINNNLPKRFRQDFVMTHHKHLLASDGVYLIDDSEKQCQSFNAAGGISILFPSPSNINYPYRDNPVQYVRSILGILNDTL